MNNKENKLYGIVEGFFSFPLPIWTPEERLNTFKFIVKYAPNINTYLYCPKNDPYVVQKWNKPYPASKLQNLQKVVNLAKKNKVKFVFGLNPPLEITHDNSQIEMWLNKVIKKFSQLQKIGINDFCLLFDDIPFAYDVLENPQSIDGQTIGKIIVTLCNEVYQRLTEVNNFWICPPDYCFKKDTKFTRELRSINPEISILWSGNDIFVKTITSSDLLRVKRILGEDKKIIWWDNYPVNDCEQNIGMFNLGGFNPPEKGANIDGILVNPMRECYANLPFYLTFENYLSSPNKYNRNRSYSRALNFLLGNYYRTFEYFVKVFSAFNNVDTEDKYLYKFASKTISLQEQLSVSKKSNSNVSYYGKKFLLAIDSIFTQSTLFAEILNKLLNNEKVQISSYIRLDIFPTNPNIPRYYSEILDIVISRVNLLKEDISSEEITLLNNLIQLSTIFRNKYIGKARLKITIQDKKILKKAIVTAITLDQKLVLKRINSNIPVRKKIESIYKRWSINRFNLI
jgi:hypothetical protein